MQIVGDRKNLKSAGLHFFYCEIKQRSVVRLKFDRSVRRQDLREPAKKFFTGQSSLGVAIFGPGI